MLTGIGREHDFRVVKPMGRRNDYGIDIITLNQRFDIGFVINAVIVGKFLRSASAGHRDRNRRLDFAGGVNMCATHEAGADHANSDFVHVTSLKLMVLYSVFWGSSLSESTQLNLLPVQRHAQPGVTT